MFSSSLLLLLRRSKKSGDKTRRRWRFKIIIQRLNNARKNLYILKSDDKLFIWNNWRSRRIRKFLCSARRMKIFPTRAYARLILWWSYKAETTPREYFLLPACWKNLYVSSRTWRSTSVHLHASSQYLRLNVSPSLSSSNFSDFTISWSPSLSDIHENLRLPRSTKMMIASRKHCCMYSVELMSLASWQWRAGRCFWVVKFPEWRTHNSQQIKS